MGKIGNNLSLILFKALLAIHWSNICFRSRIDIITISWLTLLDTSFISISASCSQALLAIWISKEPPSNWLQTISNLWRARILIFSSISDWCFSWDSNFSGNTRSKLWRLSLWWNIARWNVSRNLMPTQCQSVSMRMQQMRSCR